MREAEAAISPRIPFSYGFPLPALPLVVFLPDWRVCGQRFAQDTSRPGGAEDGHVQADLGDDGLGGDDAAAGDLVQLRDGGQHRGVRAGAGVRAGDAVGVHAPRGGDLIDQLAHLAVS